MNNQTEIGTTIVCDPDIPGLTLFERLEIERARLNFVNQDNFARHMGISPSTWLEARLGRRWPSSATYVAILRTFPELQGHVYRHLKFRAETEQHSD